jgi:hypothetical protein
MIHHDNGDAADTSEGKAKEDTADVDDADMFLQNVAQVLLLLQRNTEIKLRLPARARRCINK